MVTQNELNMDSSNEVDEYADGVSTLPSTSTAVGTPAKDDHQAIKKLETGLKFLEPLLHRSDLFRKFLRLGLGASARSIGNSKSIDSAENAAATSTATVRVSRHINNVLQEAPAHMRSELGFMPYKCKVDAIPLSRISESDIRPFEGSQDEWQLIKMAVTASAEAYDPPNVDGTTFKAKGDLKAGVVCHKKVHGQSLLIVAIRGSASLDDWMLNINGAPQASTDLLQEKIEWHTGFMRSAITMEEHVSRAISSLKCTHESADTILFTGHSAGGAIAQIFYAMSFTRNRRLSQVVSGLSKVHCIGFGAPPIANPPMHALADSSLFLSIINEGDPVALLQDEYFKTLISVCVLSADALAVKYPNGLIVPSPILRVSGTCVVLRDRNPEDPDEEGVDAVHVDPKDVEKKLFGNPSVHLKNIYLARVEQLAA